MPVGVHRLRLVAQSPYIRPLAISASDSPTSEPSSPVLAAVQRSEWRRIGTDDRQSVWPRRKIVSLFGGRRTVGGRRSAVGGRAADAFGRSVGRSFRRLYDVRSPTDQLRQRSSLGGVRRSNGSSGQRRWKRSPCYGPRGAWERPILVIDVPWVPSRQYYATSHMCRYVHVRGPLDV